MVWLVHSLAMHFASLNCAFEMYVNNNFFCFQYIFRIMVKEKMFRIETSYILLFANKMCAHMRICTIENHRARRRRDDNAIAA